MTEEAVGSTGVGCPGSSLELDVEVDGPFWNEGLEGSSVGLVDALSKMSYVWKSFFMFWIILKRHI